MIELELNDEERERLGQITADFSKDSGKTIDLEYLTSRWERFVVTVESGYDFASEDYTNELYCRGSLQHLIEKLGGRPGKQISDWLKEWDDRYYAATYESKKSLLGPLDREKEPWNFRIPKKLLPDLEADLKHLGYLD